MIEQVIDSYVKTYDLGERLAISVWDAKSNNGWSTSPTGLMAEFTFRMEALTHVTQRTMHCFSDGYHVRCFFEDGISVTVCVNAGKSDKATLNALKSAHRLNAKVLRALRDPDSLASKEYTMAFPDDIAERIVRGEVTFHFTKLILSTHGWFTLFIVNSRGVVIGQALACVRRGTRVSMLSKYQHRIGITKDHFFKTGMPAQCNGLEIKDAKPLPNAVSVTQFGSPKMAIGFSKVSRNAVYSAAHAMV